MLRDDVKKILMIMDITYPNYKITDLSSTIDVWFMFLEEYDYKEVEVALKTYIATDTSGFAPSIGQLINCIQKVEMPNELSESQAWDLVSKALRNSTYHAEEEFEKLPPVVQKVIGSATQLRNWGQTDITSIENVVQSNFMRSYRVVVQREKEVLRMPSEVRTMISQNMQNTVLIEEK